MKTTSTLLTLGLVYLLAGCQTTSTVAVTTNHDPAGKFSTYKTYALAPSKTGQVLAPVAEAALHDTLRAEMSKRGFTEVSGRKANLIIARHAFLHAPNLGSAARQLVREGLTTPEEAVRVSRRDMADIEAPLVVDAPSNG